VAVPNRGESADGENPTLDFHKDVCQKCSTRGLLLANPMTILFNDLRRRRVRAEDVLPLIGRGATLVVDLTYGAGRAFQAATDLCWQLGLEPPSAPPPLQPMLFDSASYAEAADRGVDAEAGGDQVVLAAFALASRIAPHVDADVLVLAPRFGYSIDPADAAFLGFLPDGVVTLLDVEGDHAPSPGPDDSAALIPGILGGEVAAIPGHRVSIRGGAWIVPPHLRVAPANAAVTEFDWLAIRAVSIDWLSAYAQLHSSVELVRPDLLARQAEALYTAGHTDLALARVRRLVECSKDDQRAVWLTRLQAMRIGRMRFLDAANEELPASPQSPRVEGFLKQARGWGRVMTGRATEAVHDFTEARALLASLEGTREHLYLLNISALGLARCGDLAGAEELERDIERQLAQLSPRSSALEYINAINLHRLMRAGGRLAEAREYLQRAVSTTAGTRSDNDAVYASYNLWRLAEAEGEHANALIEALHCLLFLLAIDVPEALASRTAAALLGRPWPATATWTADDLFRSAHEHFVRTLRDAGVKARAGNHVPAIVRAEKVGGELHAAGTPGLGVLLGSSPAPPRRRRSAAYGALAALTGSVLAHLLHCDVATVVVDDRHGRGLPRTQAELAEVALRLRAASLTFDGTTVVLSDVHRRDLLASARVAIGPAVERIEQQVVYFRRTREPLPLDPAAAALVEELVSGVRYPRPDEDAVRTLQAQRVVVVEVGNLGCRA